MILVSAVLSIHNRSRLFRRALDGYLWQTLPRESWEIILIDDMSNEDLSDTYKHLIGQINLTHLKMDHTRHPVWKARNPNGTKGAFENWYHTPALSINLGASFARGSVICLCHPEILHAPHNFEEAVLALNQNYSFLFGLTFLGNLSMNAYLNGNSDWTKHGWDPFLKKMRDNGQLMNFRPNELYWYTSFLPKRAIETIGGVDFSYLDGVAGEDDDFKDRVQKAGCLPVYYPKIQGFHQDHSDEKEKHRQRNTEFWNKGLEHNRALLSARRKTGSYPQHANQGYDWRARETLVEILEYKVGIATCSTPRV